MRSTLHAYTHRAPAAGGLGGARFGWLAAAVVAGLLLVALGAPLLASALLSTAPSGLKSYYWQNPLPQGNTIHSAASIGSSELWLAGDSGTLLHSTDGGAVWSPVDPGTTQSLRGIDFVSGTTGWLVGDAGTIRSTADAGESFSTQDSGTGGDLNDVAFGAVGTGWAVGDAGTIRATSDGGATAWTGQVSGTTSRLNAVDAIDALHAWAVGDAATVLYVADGSTWVAQAVPASISSTASLLGVSFADANTGWAVGGASDQPAAIIRTTDAGATWVSQVATGLADGVVLRDVIAVDADTAWAVGDGGVTVHTIDGGATWTIQNSQTSLDLQAITAASSTRAVSAGTAGVIRRTVDAGVAWNALSQGDVSQLNSVSQVDAQHAWAFGQGGTVLASTDGIAWTAQASGTGEELLGSDFVDTDNGWAAGRAGVIIATADGGANWAPQSSGTPESINSIDFADAATGWFAAGAATLGSTTDGGTTWGTQTIASISATMPLLGVSFADATTGWAVGGAEGQPATVIKSTDGGATWSVQAAPVADGTVLRAVHAIDATTAWAVGADGTVIRTTDGTTWSVVDVSATAALLSVEFIDSQRGWIVGAATGQQSVIRRTTDGGTTWTSQTPGTGRTLRDVDFISSTDGRIVGSAGTILATTDGTAPVTTLSFSPAAPDGENGWFVTAPSVSFVPDEPATTFYSIDSTTGPFATFSTAVDIPREGVTTLHYYSVDPGDNRETTQTATVRYDAGAPTVPQLPAATVTSTTVTLTWSPSFDATSGVSHYEVVRDGSVVGTSALSSLTLTGIAPETETTLTVRAYDVAGNVSADSASVHAFTLAPLPKPPVVVLARAGYRGAVALDWGESTGTAGAVQYRVWRSLDGAAYSAVTTVGVGYPGSWIDTSVVAPAQVSYLVSVIDSRGEGEASTATASSAVTLTALPAPVRLRAVATSTSIETSWSALTGATGYRVYRATTSTGTGTLLTAAPVAGTSYSDTTEAADTDYWYHVAAIDASGVVGALSRPVFVHSESPSAVDAPHGAYDPLTDECGLCHRSHSSTNLLALLTSSGDNEIPLCLSCHDGTSAPDVLDEFADPAMANRHPVTVDGGATVLRCGSCHTPHNDNGGAELGKLLYAEGGVRSGNDICLACHGDASTLPRGDLRLFNSSGHGASVPAPADGVGVVCLGCHRGHATRETALVPYGDDERCVACHSADKALPGSVDIAGALSGSGSDTRHDLLVADQAANGSKMGCTNCHEPHTATPATPTVDPDAPTTANPWTGDASALCLRCHDAALPTSADTSGWASAPLGAGGAASVADIASLWPTDVHGGGSSTPSFLRPDMGWVAGDTMTCEACHDPHGSANRWTLRGSVAATGNAQIAEGLLVVPVGAGADLRFFCGSCHIVGPATHPGVAAGGADLTAWPIDCTASGCHTHAGTGL